jgi:hypothetical protein
LDAIEATIKSGGEFVAGEGAVAAIGFVGVAGDAAVAFDQGLEGLEGPVGGFYVGELGYGGDLGERAGSGRLGSIAWAGRAAIRVSWRMINRRLR